MVDGAETAGGHPAMVFPWDGFLKLKEPNLD